jgi:hypothetical protein
MIDHLQIIDDYEWHPITRQALITAGWFPGRHVSVETWRQQLLEEGYQWTETVQAFLTCFGNLSIHPIETQEAIFGSSVLIIDPSLVVGEYDGLQTREEILHEAICPIGEYGGQSFLLFGVSGKVYVDASYQILLYGNTFQEALDVIARAHRYPQLLYGKVWWSE